MTQECCICYNEIEEKMMIELECHHSFCYDCVVTIVKEDVSKCPLCRANIHFICCDENLINSIDTCYKFLIVFLTKGVKNNVTIINLKEKIIYEVEFTDIKFNITSINFDDCCKNYNVKHPLIYYKNNNYIEMKDDKKEQILIKIINLYTEIWKLKKVF